MFKGKVTTLLSETLVQVMLGVGLPSAVQLSLTSSPSFNVWLPEMSVILGGSIYIRDLLVITNFLILGC